MTEDLDREQTPEEPDRVHFLEMGDGEVIDTRGVERATSDLLFRYITEHPERRRDVETRPPGLNWRPIGDGIVEVLFPPTDERPELVIGRLPLAVFRA